MLLKTSWELSNQFVPMFQHALQLTNYYLSFAGINVVLIITVALCQCYGKKMLHTWVAMCSVLFLCSYITLIYFIVFIAVRVSSRLWEGAGEWHGLSANWSLNSTALSKNRLLKNYMLYVQNLIQYLILSHPLMRLFLMVACFTNLFCRKMWFIIKPWLQHGWRRMRPILTVPTQQPLNSSHSTQVQ